MLVSHDVVSGLYVVTEPVAFVVIQRGRQHPLGAELLFQIITEREEKASIACASNAPFSEWSKTFTDPRLAAAIVDRLTFNAHIIQTGTDSYRPRRQEGGRRWLTPHGARPSPSRTVTGRAAPHMTAGGATSSHHSGAK